MARIPKIRTNVSAPFPTLVKGSGPITVAKAAGVWTVGFTFAPLANQIPAPANYATDYLLVYDSLTGSFFKMSIANIIAAATTFPSFDTVAGDYNVAGETTLLINKAVPAAHNINLPPAATRNSVPIVIKDYAGNAAANIATIIPSGAERIDGLAALPINSNYGGFRLVPVTIAGGAPANGWFISP